jgi:hypothetical protein
MRVLRRKGNDGLLHYRVNLPAAYNADIPEVLALVRFQRFDFLVVIRDDRSVPIQPGLPPTLHGIG